MNKLINLYLHRKFYLTLHIYRKWNILNKYKNNIYTLFKKTWLCIIFKSNKWVKTMQAHKKNILNMFNIINIEKK